MLSFSKKTHVYIKGRSHFKLMKMHLTYKIPFNTLSPAGNFSTAHSKEIAGNQTDITGSQTILIIPQPKLARSKPKLADSKLKLAGSKPQLAGSKPQLAGAKPKLASSKPKLAGSKPQLADPKSKFAGHQTLSMCKKANITVYKFQNVSNKPLLTF
jgi:hypothetical protein